jgi:hypothetical protein
MDCWITQLVRPNGTVLTESLSSEDYGPSFLIPHPQEDDLIEGETYGRCRLSSSTSWLVTHYWPNGPHYLPAFSDHTGEGHFISCDPADSPRPRNDASRRLCKSSPPKSPRAAAAGVAEVKPGSEEET